jgi:hypothetical protein
MTIGGQGQISREIIQLLAFCNPFGGGGRNFFSAESDFDPAALGEATKIWQDKRCM